MRVCQSLAYCRVFSGTRGFRLVASASILLPEILCIASLFFIHFSIPFTMASNQFDSQASTNYKEAFALFDKRGNGRCTSDALGDLLRACGQNPTLAEIDDLQKSLGQECE